MKNFLTKTILGLGVLAVSLSANINKVGSSAITPLSKENTVVDNVINYILINPKKLGAIGVQDSLSVINIKKLGAIGVQDSLEN